MEYLLNDKQKSLMQQIHKLNEQKEEEEKEKQFSNQNLFNSKNNLDLKNEEINNTSIIPTKENFFTRIINKIKKLFTKK